MTSTPTLAPVLFVSHGTPTFAIEPGTLGPLLATLGQTLQGITAVLVVSPHWQTRGVQVMASAAPETVYDFGGFPQALYSLRYPAPGAPAIAAEVQRVLADAGWPVALDARRGLDHGAWVPLRHLLPAANIPVFQVSMPHDLDTAGALRLGQALAPLRAQGVLVLASGSMTHNLYEFRHAHTAAADYAVEFTHWIRQAVTGSAVDKLVDYRRLAPHAERAHPSEEHYLPLLVAMGARSALEAPTVIDGGMTHGVLSMESYAWGLPATSH
ncbi:class III extradiol ring-cleavage dioxygenase [Rhodoferax sp.]|uniref:DODA-type extradiol aromatic ring-opening family dioxygenase n=1 Tax=Rhodoferax sp. TaxID=50421 RepID=UPI0025F99A1D|nr:class III extradiol ring-cleavage dioxygenase [Rhodoferax sp.]